jgi:hypothetical protein
MGMIRTGTLKDLETLTPWIDELTKNFPYLKPDNQKIRDTALQLSSSAQHYFKVIESDGQVVAALAAITIDNLWAEKRCSMPVLWVSKQQGAGSELLADYAAWVLSRPVLKFAAFMTQIDWDAKVDDKLIEAGFKRSGNAFILTRT